MSLVLTVRAGDSFWVGANEYVLDEIISFTEAVIVRVKDSKSFRIGRRRPAEIEPDVTVAIGDRSQLEIARLSISAPRHILIGRDGAIAANQT